MFVTIFEMLTSQLKPDSKIFNPEIDKIISTRFPIIKKNIKQVLI